MVADRFHPCLFSSAAAQKQPMTRWIGVFSNDAQIETITIYSIMDD